MSGRSVFGMFLVAIVGAALWFSPGASFEGGTELEYRIDVLTVRPELRPTLISDVQKVIAARLERAGSRSFDIAPPESDLLRIRLPAMTGPELERYKQLIESAGEISFHLRSAPEFQQAQALDEIDQAWRDHEAKRRASGAQEEAARPERRVVIPRISQDGRERVDPADRVAVECDFRSSVSNEFFEHASVTMDEYGGPAIAFEFAEAGATAFGEMTGNNVGVRLCIVLDGVMLQQATIEERIDGRGRVTGSFTSMEANQIVDLLESESLPVKPRLVGERIIESQR